jgi:hypothetical protein
MPRPMTTHGNEKSKSRPGSNNFIQQSKKHSTVKHMKSYTKKQKELYSVDFKRRVTELKRKSKRKNHIEEEIDPNEDFMPRKLKEVLVSMGKMSQDELLTKTQKKRKQDSEKSSSSSGNRNSSASASKNNKRFNKNVTNDQYSGSNRSNKRRRRKELKLQQNGEAQMDSLSDGDAPNSDFEHDYIPFGEVVSQPPTISMIPKLDPSLFPDQKSFEKVAKRLNEKPALPDKSQQSFIEIRNRAVDLYRKFKDNFRSSTQSNYAEY